VRLKTALLRIIKELGYRVNCGVENSCIEGYKGIIIVHEIK